MKWLLLVTLIAAMNAEASSAPQSFTYQGRLYKSDGVTPVDSSSVLFTIQLRSPDGACVLFEETHTRNLSSSEGTFSLIIGEGTNTNATALSISNVFDNLSAKSGVSCNYTPAASDFRRLRLTYDDGIDNITLAPDQTIRSVPYALMANSLQGLNKDQFIQVSSNTTQVKVDAVFANYAALVDLINGNSSLYNRPSDTPTAGGDLSGTLPNPTVAKIRGVTISSTAPTNGQVLKYNSSTSQWEASADVGNLGTVTSVTASAPLSVSGTANAVVSLQSGSSAGQTLHWNGSAWSVSFPSFSDLRGIGTTAQFPTNCTSAQVWSYSAVSDIYTCSNISVSNTQVSGLGTASTMNVGTAAGTVAAGNDSRIVNAVQSGGSIGGDLSGTFSSPTISKIRGVTVSATAPTAGQILKYNSTTSQWEPGADLSNAGTVTSVAAGTGLVSNTITSTGTLNVDVGTSANKIVQLDSSAKLPAVDGSQLTNLNVSIPFKNLQVFSAVGSTTWTPPAGVTKVYVEVWGSGGGGSGGRPNSAGGMGGGAGAYGAWIQAVTPGLAVSVVVGAGGTGGGNNASGTNGNSSTFDVTSVSGGTAGSIAAVGAGGASPVGTNVIGMTGGSGNVGSLATVTQNLVTVLGISVLGTVDVSGLGGAGGTAARGGAGGNGSGASATTAGAGAAPGGGGGAGGSTGATNGSTGGAGGAGRVIIWY